MKPAQLLDCLMIIKPATLIGWHRQIVRHHGAFLATEANFRRIDGYRDLWMLKGGAG
jgi:hypothetical protein